jgi:hypothetical protein
VDGCLGVGGTSFGEDGERHVGTLAGVCRS